MRCRITDFPAFRDVCERQALFDNLAGDPAAPGLNRTVHDLFSAQAQRTPDALALTFAALLLFFE